LASLVEAGLLIRKDSPNGKRFARRDGEGEVEQAYGFNISPLIARAGEIQSLAAQVSIERETLKATKERLSLCRRDISKFIETALEEGIPGDWTAVHQQFRGLVGEIPRAPTIHQIEPIVEEMEMLREEVLNLLEIRVNAQNLNGNESQTERHIQNSKPESISDLEPASNKKQGKNSVVIHEVLGEPQNVGTATTKPETQTVGRLNMSSRAAREAGTSLKSFPLGLVLQACPEIVSYGPSGNVASWRDLMAAAIVVRSMLGVSPNAYQEACDIMGAENAATVMACVLERAGSTTSAGGYLRDLTRRAERGEFAIGPMLMALAKGASTEARHTA
jgi:replication initiation protein RepC